MHLDKLPGRFFGPPSLVGVVRHRATHQPEDPAFIYLVDGENEQVHLSYRELDRQARAIGAWLETQGLVGERALLLYPAGLEFIAAFLGCLYAGVVAVPVYPPRRNRSLDRIRAVADDCDAKVALTTDVVFNRAKSFVRETPHLKDLTWLATCHVPEGIERHWKMPDIHGDTLAFLQYTSGSTGTPKGVMLNHGNLLHNSAMIAYAFEHTRSGLGVFWLPSYHDMGLIGGILQPLYIGRPNILMSPMSFLQKPFRWLSAISRFGCTTSGGPNFAYDLCVQKITPEQRETLDLSAWTVAFNGAEPVREETIRQFTETFAPCGFHPEAFYSCYGMAEAALLVSGGHVNEPPVIRSFRSDRLLTGRAVPSEPGDDKPSDGGARPLVGCGGTLADQEILIADPETLDQYPDGRIGEIWVRGPSIAQGYWRQPELTKEMFGAHVKDSTGRDTDVGPFLRTGDLGFIHDGELFVTGRIKDLIILYGMNHYPQDIELTVQHAATRLRRDCGAAFTVEEDGREKLVVVQEIDRRKQGHLETIFKAIRRDVSVEHEIGLDAVVLIKAGSIPKTSSGKVQRHVCRRGYLDGSLEVVGRWELAEGEGKLSEGEEVLEAVPEQPVQARRETDSAVPLAEATGVVTRSSRDAADVSGNGRDAATVDHDKTAELVLEQVRIVARERAVGLTLDSSILELGLDSIERVEIVVSLEERFGGRFPEEILPELITCRQVVEAVHQYLGREPRPKDALAPGAEIPDEYFHIEAFPEVVQLEQSLDVLEPAGLHNPFFIAHQGVVNDRVVIDSRELINFSSFNYLGMSGDPVVIRAAREAAAEYGTSVSASRLVAGEIELHGELERALARLHGTEDAAAFVAGHATNETVIGHLLGPADLILHDALSHNSIIQGSILSGARRRPFAHNDWQKADQLLEQFRHEYRRVLLVIEGVYSMDGDIPDLPKFIEVKQRHKALLMVDEAHSVGTLGKHGRGTREHFGIAPEDVDIWMSTLSKTLGSSGGYIAGSKELIKYLKYTAPGFVFGVGLSPLAAAAALAALRLIEAEPERVARLQENSRLFLELARQRGLNTGMSQDTPIVPIILGNSIHCMKLSRAMFERGVSAQPILHPAVEESAARVRYFIASQHTEEQIRYTIDVMTEELEKINPKYVTQALGS